MTTPGVSQLAEIPGRRSLLRDTCLGSMAPRGSAGPLSEFKVGKRYGADTDSGVFTIGLLAS